MRHSLALKLGFNGDNWALSAEHFELRFLTLQLGAQILTAFRGGGALSSRVSARDDRK